MLLIDFQSEERLSDSPLVDVIWYSRGEYPTQFISMAQTRWSLVIASLDGKLSVGTHGPETKATRMVAPGNAEFLSVMFKVGTMMPLIPPTKITDTADFIFPNATNDSFWLGSRTWQVPNKENVDVFIDQLVREGLLIQDKVVVDTIKRQPQEISLRSVQRRFKQATGLTYGIFEQINRARYATKLLKSGRCTAEVESEAGYYDQSHLIRSLKRFIGLTPQQIIAPDRKIPLSFLYNTLFD